MPHLKNFKPYTFQPVYDNNPVCSNGVLPCAIIRIRSAVNRYLCPYYKPPEHEHLTEQELTERLKQGDEAAFRHVVQMWQDMIFNTVLGMVQNENDAEDITQEVFVKAFESIAGFKGESKLSTWLYRIAVTKSLDFLRSKKRKKRFAFVTSLFGANEEVIHQPPDFNHPGVVLDNKQRAAVLFKAVDKLPEQQKVAFTLHKLEGLSYKEISEVLNTTVPAVESLMQRARGNLKKLLQDYFNENG